MSKLEPYSRKLPYSYALGLYPSHALMDARPESVRRLLLSSAAYGNEGAEKLRERCKVLGIREENAERVLRRESKKENCFAGLVFEKYADPPRQAQNHVVFCQISDSGNLGTALRSLLAFGIADAALIRPCVDPFDPHTLRASMGAFYKMRVAIYDTFDDYRENYPAHALYPFMLDGSLPLQEVARAARAPYALVFGNEATGLPAHFQARGQTVRIPQSDQVDSLNLAIAAAVGAYAFAHRTEEEKK